MSYADTVPAIIDSAGGGVAAVANHGYYFLGPSGVDEPLVSLDSLEPGGYDARDWLQRVEAVAAVTEPDEHRTVRVAINTDGPDEAVVKYPHTAPGKPYTRCLKTG